MPEPGKPARRQWIVIFPRFVLDHPVVSVKTRSNGFLGRTPGLGNVVLQQQRAGPRNMCKVISDRYRCPEQFVGTSLTTPLSAESVYARFAHGRSCSMPPVASPLQPSFDVTQLVDNLPHERFVTNSH